MENMGDEIGEISNYFSKINVAVVNLSAPVSQGEKILIKGSTTHFEQTLDSMQIEHQNIERAESGQSIGLKVVDIVQKGDKLFRLA